MLMIGEEDDESLNEDEDEEGEDSDSQTSKDDELERDLNNLGGTSNQGMDNIENEIVENDDMESFLAYENPSPAIEFQNMSDILMSTASNCGGCGRKSKTIDASNQASVGYSP